MFSDYSVILWDFDGVILDSNNIRTNGFRHIFKNYDQDYVNKLIDFHVRNGGLSRYEKIDYFFNDILGEKLTLLEKNNHLGRFTNYCKKKLCDKKLLIQDSLEFIEKNYKNFKFHLVSASDEKELIYITSRLEITDYFISIHGSPDTKTININNILNDNNYKRANCCLVGDSINDKQAALNNKISFFGYNNQELKKNSEYVFSFNY